MVSSVRKKAANAVGGKSIRACDSCVRRRARWYCAADDAFLCQSCDSSVHSANPLARRHERVRLRRASVRSSDDESGPGAQTSVPMWHQGFIKKPRTPRRKKRAKISNPLPLVPEICSEKHSHEENEEQLLYRVPIFDPTNSNESVRNNIKNADETARAGLRHETKPVANHLGQEMNHFQRLSPSEMDLAEFGADVESLLGKGLEDESFDIEGLGLLDCGEMQKVKVEDEEIEEVPNRGVGQEFIDVGREIFDLNFGYDSPVTGEEEDHKVEILKPNFMNDSGNPKELPDSKRKGIFLKLDYKGVLSAWDSQKSPWTTGERPDLNSGGWWPDCTDAMCGTMHAYRERGVTSGHEAAKTADGGREAKVSRYREKRRTRLLSKKIRYEVRKLNAEKRPRMKGRFVKRANLVAPAAAFTIAQ